MRSSALRDLPFPAWRSSAKKRWAAKCIRMNETRFGHVRWSKGAIWRRPMGTNGPGNPILWIVLALVAASVALLESARTEQMPFGVRIVSPVAKCR